MRRILLCLFLFAVMTEFSATAQPITGTTYTDKPLRVEIPARSVNETYRIIPCGSQGMIIFFKSQEVVDELKVKWYFSFYDTNLRLVWSKSVPLLTDLDCRFHQSGRDTLSLLFIYTGKSRNTEKDFNILRIVLDKSTMIMNTGKIPQDADAVAFGIRLGLGWIGFNVKGQPGKILNIRLDRGTMHSFLLGQGSQILLKWMQPDSSSNTVLCVVSRQVSKRLLEHYLVRYDSMGVIQSEVPIGEHNDYRTLAHVRFATPGPGSGLVLGCYGQGVSSSGQKDKILAESTGFFASNIVGGAQKSVGFFNFLELKNAGSLLNEHDIINLKKKALKKNKTLSEYSLDYTLLLHSVYSWNDQYVLAAEIFTPQYHTESFTDFDYYGRPYTNSFSVFDGYRFFNTIIAGIDKTGNLLWDNTFEIRNLVSMDLSAKVVVFPSGSDLVLCYVSDGKIGSKIIHENNVVEKTDFAPIDMLYPDDKILSESKGRIVQWYGNYFLTYAYQEIKNLAIETNNKRLVFYFSKVGFEK